MVKSIASTPSEYLASLPPERRKVIAAVRKLVRANLPKGYKEAMNWGMLSYEVPLARFPKTYNGQPLMYAALAAQKHHNAIYLMSLYADPALYAQFERTIAKLGKRISVGKCCVRFRELDDLPAAVIGKIIARTSVAQYIEMYNSRYDTAAKRGPVKKKRAARAR